MISHVDVRHILGDLNDHLVARVLALRPDLADLEAAALCIDGQTDVLEDSAERPSGIVAEIVDIVRESEEDETDGAPRTRQ